MVDRLLRGGRVIPVFESEPGGGVIENGAVAIEHGRVAEVGPFEALSERHRGAQVIGSERHVVIPGLVNAHHHGYGLPGYKLGCADDALEVWVPDPLRRRPLDLYLDTLYADLRLVRSGVTTVLHQGYARGAFPPEEGHRAALAAHANLGLRVAYAVGHQDSNPLLYGDTEAFLHSLPAEAAKHLAPWVEEKLSAPDWDYFGFLEALCSEHQGSERVRILAGPEGPEWCSPALLGRVAKAAADLGIGVHIHVLESPMQRELALCTDGANTVAALEALALLGPGHSIAHAAWFNDDDMRRCADTGTSVVHNPSSNLRLRNGIAPVARMQALGVNLAIGCDSTALNCDDDLLQEIRLAQYLHRAPGPSPLSPCPSPRDVLRMATVNARAPTGFGDAIGALTPGSHADAVLIDFDALAYPYLDPGLDLAESLVVLADHRHVDTVVIGGEVVLRDGAFVNVDERDVAERLVASIEERPALRRVAAHLRPHLRRYYEERYEGVDREPYYAVNSRAGA